MRADSFGVPEQLRFSGLLLCALRFADQGGEPVNPAIDS